jgi:hypothetical protein
MRDRSARSLKELADKCRKLASMKNVSPNLAAEMRLMAEQLEADATREEQRLNNGPTIQIY